MHPYLVFCIPDKDAGIVTALHVIHAGRDIDCLLSARPF